MNVIQERSMMGLIEGARLIVSNIDRVISRMLSWVPRIAWWIPWVPRITHWVSSAVTLVSIAIHLKNDGQYDQDYSSDC